MDNALSWGTEDRLAYKKASNARTMREGVPELIQWVAKATRRHGTKTTTAEDRFCFFTGAPMHGTHTSVE